MEHSAVRLSCIKIPHGFQTFVLSIFEWRPKTGFTVLLVTLCMLGNFASFLSSTICIFFHNESFRNSIIVTNSMHPDQAGCLSGPDLAQNCFERLQGSYRQVCARFKDFSKTLQ